MKARKAVDTKVVLSLRIFCCLSKGRPLLFDRPWALFKNRSFFASFELLTQRLNKDRRTRADVSTATTRLSSCIYCPQNETFFSFHHVALMNKRAYEVSVEQTVEAKKFTNKRK